MQFADHRIYIYIALALLLAVMLLTRHIERTRFGRALLAIKQNEAAAEAAGIDTYRWKLKAITLSGAVAGAVGAFYAVVLLVVTPVSVFGMLVSAQALVVTMFGGIGTVWGPVIGAAILIPRGRDAARGAGLGAARHPGRDLRRRDHRRHAGRAGRRVLERARRAAPALRQGDGDARRRRRRSGNVVRLTPAERSERAAHGRGARRGHPRGAQAVEELRRPQGGRGRQLPGAQGR